VQAPCNLFGGVLFSDLGFEIWVLVACLVRVLFSDHGFELWACGFSIVAKPLCMLHVAYLVNVLFSDRAFEILPCGFSIVSRVLFGKFFLCLSYI